MNLANHQYGNIEAISEYLEAEKKGILQQGKWASSVSFPSALRWEIKN